MATTKETPDNKKRAYQKATISIVELAGKTSLLSGSGNITPSVLNNSFLG